MALITYFAYICIFAGGAYIAKRLLDLRYAPPLPPGPTGWPVVGSISFISSKKNWQGFAALGKKYGDISTINILGTRYVVLNSPRAISAILEKQSIKCSDRPQLTMAGSLVGLSEAIVLGNYDDRFRQSRKLFSRCFGSKGGVTMFNQIQEEQICRFLNDVLRNPNNLPEHIRVNARAIILKVAYGYTVQEGRDPFVELAGETMEMFSLVTTPGAFLVDFIPALRHLPEWLPGMGFLKDAKKYRQLIVDAALRPHQYVMEQMAAGTAIPSFTSTLLEEGVSPEEEDLIKWTSMNIYIGASDTTVSAIYAFFLLMVLYPGVQAKACAELDSVVGNGRLPRFNDRDSLPYINALCKEVLRWHTITPLGLPHCATEDFYSDGFLIPKGSHIIGNIWAVLRDEATYPDPSVFRPERFLGDAPQPDPRSVCFGFGRRVCPGYLFADAFLFISVATSLAVFKISTAVIDGVEIIPEYNVTPGTVSHPEPFKCQISARSTRTEALIHG